MVTVANKKQEQPKPTGQQLKPEQTPIADKSTEIDKPKPIVATPVNAQPSTLISVDNSDFACFLDTAKFNQLWRGAKLLSETELVPAQYRGKPSDCFVALQMSIRLKADPMMLMQNTYVVHGKPGMEAKFVIALVNSRGPFKGPIQWKFKGEGRSRQCTAYATHRVTNEVCEATVTWEMVEKEGWCKKEGSKWLTMPDLMFQYRSASFLANLYCPETKMGMMTVEELGDINLTPPRTFDDAKKEAGEKIEEELGSKSIDADFEKTDTAKAADGKGKGKRKVVKNEAEPQTDNPQAPDKEGEPGFMNFKK